NRRPRRFLRPGRTRRFPHNIRFRTTRIDRRPGLPPGPLGTLEGILPMPLGLIGTKVGMTQVFDDKGTLSPVTVLQIGPCPVLQLRTADTDGYHAVQLG